MQNQARDQVIKTLKEANCVLVTVKNGPTVDELSAAIALTLLLNRMNKHAVTVFSGRVPSMLEFLQPEMAIDTNTDSLRDFIIALDKSKADKLRYKVEDNVVRIFITPYKTSISEKDLEFSQGDFNVDVVVALGVVTKDDFDQAVTVHGRILHDATVIALTKQTTLSQIGAVNWQHAQASSVSEMIAGIADALGENVMDGQIATALMTGIVAETDRFRNGLTTPDVMNISARLMSAGANQQLIAEKLEAPDMDSVAQPLSFNEDSGDDGALEITHTDEEVQPIHIDDHGNLNVPAEDVPQQQNEYIARAETQAFDAQMTDQPLYEAPEDTTESPHVEQQTRTYVAPPEPPKLYGQDDSGMVGAQPLFDTQHTPPNTALETTLPDVSQSLDTHHKVIEPLPGGEDHGSYGRPFVPPQETPEANQPPAPVDTASAPTPEPATSTPPPVMMPPAGQTLAEIEKSVGRVQTENGQPLSTENPEDFIGSTRTPVNAESKEPDTSSESDNKETEEEKVDDENLIKIPDTPQQVTPQVINPNAPPEVPPPLMPAPTQPQFFDADGNTANPFLNPN